MKKVFPMNSSPKLKYEIELILDQLEKKGIAVTNDMSAFRYFSRMVSDCREKNQIWISVGCAIEKRNGMHHIIQVNPDFKFERCNGMSFNLVYRY